jgi:hypothetical protein
VTDDDVRRAELARLGIARSGPARSGVARANVTDKTILDRLLVEHAEARKGKAARKSKLQKGQQQATAKRRKKRDAFMRAVDRERQKSDAVTPREAVTAVLKRTGVRNVSWVQLSPIERQKAVDAGVKRYSHAKHADPP